MAALRDGRPGTAMPAFKDVLSDAEAEAVAFFVADQFMRRRAVNTYYHTPENGWPDHRGRYGAAYPFVRGETSPLTPPEALDAAARAGLALVRESCTSCHDLGNSAPPRRWAIPGAPPAAPGSADAEADDEPGYSREGMAQHDVAPTLAAASAEERRGEALYQRVCAYCHAADGTGENWIGEFLRPHPPDLTGATLAGLSDAALDDAIAQGLPQTSMPAFGAVLDAGDRAAVIAYLRRAFQPPAAPRNPD
jgi:cytochrome c oxidase cbb3-type subunit 3